MPARHDLSTLRLLGTVGEPINPEAWMWYQEHIGGGRCPIVDTWWQTETGGIMITPLPGVTTTKPGSATMPFPGIDVELVDTTGKALAKGGGFLTLTEPWPGMLRTIYGDDARYRETYWSRFPGRYFAGDGAKVRRRRLLVAAGPGRRRAERRGPPHRHDGSRERAGRSSRRGGGGGGRQDARSQGAGDRRVRHASGRGSSRPPSLRDDLREHVGRKIGAIARPDDILFSADLPKTRSGKIMRRLLRDIAEGRALGDTTTLADPNVVAKLKEMYEDKE